MADERSDERAQAAVSGPTDGPSGTARRPPDPGVARDDPDEGTVRVVVLVRAHCRTCDRMEGVVREICAREGEEHMTLDVDDPATDPEWRAEYGDRIPVTLVDGVEVGSWRLEPAALTAALREGAA